jgi:uncharacterized protein (DUF1786 family)
MLRYMISPIIGNGSVPSPYRAAVSGLPNVNAAAIIPTHTSGPDIGKPKYNFALCFCATSNIVTLEQVSNAFVFPDYNLDGRMDGMESSVRSAMVQNLQAYNMDGNGIHLDASHADGDSYRSLIVSIGQQIEPAFAINNLNVGEVAQ